ncbi:MAG: protocatechuate 3,4-dioxygenase subunit beta [Gammaproteobacteria bacterium]
MSDFRPVPPGVYPSNDWPDYRSTARRAPRQPAVAIPHTVSETTGPGWGAERLRADATDLTRPSAGGVAQGQRILVHGRVCDEYGRAIGGALIEVWQANAAGRYRHDNDRHDAPLDPYFIGAGQCLTDAAGCYAFHTIEPGAYPWGNHDNAWRPRHIHFSLFGNAWGSRLVTQMYFPGDPLLPRDPIFMGVPDTQARERLVSAFDPVRTEPGQALAYRFDIVLRGPSETPWENRP